MSSLGCVALIRPRAYGNKTGCVAGKAGFTLGLIAGLERAGVTPGHGEGLGKNGVCFGLQIPIEPEFPLGGGKVVGGGVIPPEGGRLVEGGRDGDPVQATGQ